MRSDFSLDAARKYAKERKRGTVRKRVRVRVIEREREGGKEKVRLNSALIVN